MFYKNHKNTSGYTCDNQMMVNMLEHKHNKKIVELNKKLLKITENITSNNYYNSMYIDINMYNEICKSKSKTNKN